MKKNWGAIIPILLFFCLSCSSTTTDSTGRAGCRSPSQEDNVPLCKIQDVSQKRKSPIPVSRKKRAHDKGYR